MPNDDTDKNVYILGAGFSKELGLPLQDDFLLLAKEVYFRDPERYKHFIDVFDYQDKLSKMLKFLNYPLLNLEHLFNLVEIDLFYTGDEEQTTKNSFVKLIHDTIAELTPNPFFHNAGGTIKVNYKKYGNYSRFLNMFIKPDTKYKDGIIPYNDTIINFNYDLVVEITASIYNWTKSSNLRTLYLTKGCNYYILLNVLFEKQNIKLGSIEQFFENKRAGGFFPSTGEIFTAAEPHIKLIKLHGSVNWTSNSDNEKPFIVPPTWNKSDQEIRKLWEEAYKKLKEAKRIIIIGYSFPETDIYVKSLLALALNENKILQNIYFINPDKDRVKETSLALLDKHFKKHCEYKEWTFYEFITSEPGKRFIREKLNRPI